MRLLEDVEITMLEEQGCTAENWLAVMVSEEFRPDAVHNVNFYGTVELGAFYDNIEVEEGFWKRSGIRNATLRNVTIGDNCLIENVSGHISGYDIAPGCYIANVGTISALATDFGNGIELSVLSEAGEPNVVLSDKLTAQLAFLMIQSNAVFKMVKKECAMDADASERGVIGERVRITFTREISNARVGDYCEVQGASRISNTSLMSSDDAPTFIGSDVIIENSIVAQGASVVDGAKVDSCFVGENVHVGKGFTAISSLFFANCFLDNGEANASFLGPFCTARHKSTFLVGGVFLFYDAAAGVNQSNHLYKTGPLHWGRFDRGAKTTNNSHIDWPAHIGAFSLLKGDLTSHPVLCHHRDRWQDIRGAWTQLLFCGRVARCGKMEETRPASTWQPPRLHYHRLPQPIPDPANHGGKRHPTALGSGAGRGSGGIHLRQVLYQKRSTATRQQLLRHGHQGLYRVRHP